MTSDASDQRLALLAAAADEEQRLIDAEIEAEAALARAEERLARVQKDVDRIQRDLDERQRRVNEARAVLTAVQERRAMGPA